MHIHVHGVTGHRSVPHFTAIHISAMARLPLPSNATCTTQWLASSIVTGPPRGLSYQPYLLAFVLLCSEASVHHHSALTNQTFRSKNLEYVVDAEEADIEQRKYVICTLLISAAYFRYRVIYGTNTDSFYFSYLIFITKLLNFTWKYYAWIAVIIIVIIPIKMFIFSLWLSNLSTLLGSHNIHFTFTIQNTPRLDHFESCQ